MLPSRLKRSSPPFPAKRQVDKLHGQPPLEPAITALGKPNVSHSTLADLRDQRVGPECPGPQGLAQLDHAGRTLLQKTFLHQHTVFVQQCCQLCS